ncbi:MAG: dienelactone hydrolase [Bacteroidia bacterium]|jgi:dienelactone hydrolase
MKKALLAVVALLVLTSISLLFAPVRAYLIAESLPDYPDWPEPTFALAGDETGALYYPTSSPYDLQVIFNDMRLARATTGLGYLSYPAGASAEAPVPAMVIVPGSGGIAAGREHEYAQWFNERGVAAFVVEYYVPRGFNNDSNYIIRTSSVTEFDLIADAYAARKLLGTSPLIDAKRIGMIGFSYGGMAARLAMDSRIYRSLAQDAPPFDLHIDAYGPCFQNLRSTELTGAPLLTLRGTADASNDLKACAAREQELRDLETQVTARIYPGAGHAWENLEPSHFSEGSPYLAGCELAYDQTGQALLNGIAITDYEIDASHAQKMQARFTSGPLFRDCLRYGYNVGRNEQARAQGYADIESFISGQWFSKQASAK